MCELLPFSQRKELTCLEANFISGRGDLEKSAGNKKISDPFRVLRVTYFCVCACRYNTEQYSPYAAPSPQGSYQPSPSPQSYHQVAPSPVGYQNTHSPASYHPTPSPMAYQVGEVDCFPTLCNLKYKSA